MAISCFNTFTAPQITRGELCGHPAERFAEVALQAEPTGAIWCKQYGTVKAALYRAFGGLLAQFNDRLCDLLRENTGCESVETLAEWEVEFGLPSACQTDYPTDTAGRQAQVCAARLGGNIRTIQDLQSGLITATGCEFIVLKNTPTGVCISGITGAASVPAVHNVVGGWGAISQGYGSAVGQPLLLQDPLYVAPQYCPMVYHSVVGGWTGGVGSALTQQTIEYQTVVCLMQKHVPAHVNWYICND